MDSMFRKSPGEGTRDDDIESSLAAMLGSILRRFDGIIASPAYG